jgi:hypothetical protein
VSLSTPSVKPTLCRGANHLDRSSDVRAVTLMRPSATVMPSRNMRFCLIAPQKMFPIGDSVSDEVAHVDSLTNSRQTIHKGNDHSDLLCAYSAPAFRRLTVKHSLDAGCRFQLHRPKRRESVSVVELCPSLSATSFGCVPAWSSRLAHVRRKQ